MPTRPWGERPHDSSALQAHGVAAARRVAGASCSAQRSDTQPVAPSVRDAAWMAWPWGADRIASARIEYACRTMFLARMDAKARLGPLYTGADGALCALYEISMALCAKQGEESLETLPHAPCLGGTPWAGRPRTTRGERGPQSTVRCGLSRRLGPPWRHR